MVKAALNGTASIIDNNYAPRCTYKTAHITQQYDTSKAAGPVTLTADALLNTA